MTAGSGDLDWHSLAAFVSHYAPGSSDPMELPVDRLLAIADDEDRRLDGIGGRTEPLTPVAHQLRHELPLRPARRRRDHVFGPLGMAAGQGLQGGSLVAHADTVVRTNPRATAGSCGPIASPLPPYPPDLVHEHDGPPGSPGLASAP